MKSKNQILVYETVPLSNFLIANGFSGTETMRICKCAEYSADCMEKAGKKYDGKPYVVHLVTVFLTALNYLQLLKHLDREEQVSVLCAAFTHDLLEDTTQTLSQIMKVCDTPTCMLCSMITNLLTAEKKETHEATMNESYYDQVKEIDAAVFLKLCDRLANVSWRGPKSMEKREMYKKEYKHFKKAFGKYTEFKPILTQIYKELYQPIFIRTYK